jgi:5,10-methylenetetrahydrofolate reductase
MPHFLLTRTAYELNPPKIARNGRYDSRSLRHDMDVLLKRASQLRHADGIHLTDSVLGVPRISSITAAGHVKKVAKGAKLSCSVRTSDRNAITLCQAAADAIAIGVDSLLILLGDAPTDGRDSGLKPSAAVTMLKDLGFGGRIKLNLSFPDKIANKESPAIQNKLAARPHALVTQSISSLSDLADIVDLARPHGIKVVACIMVPADKNFQSAKMIGLDWSGYEKEPAEFVKKAGRMAGSVLLTSPNSFKAGLELLKQVSC